MMLSEQNLLSLMKKHFPSGTLNVLTYSVDEKLTVNSIFYHFLQDFEVACRMKDKLFDGLTKISEVNREIQFLETEISRLIKSEKD